MKMTKRVFMRVWGEVQPKTDPITSHNWNGAVQHRVLNKQAKSLYWLWVFHLSFSAGLFSSLLFRPFFALLPKTGETHE